MTEQFQNFGETTLNGAISSATATSVVVTDGSVFPSSGNFRVLVDDELMLVTARSTNTLTVTRGAESTTAATHTDGSDIKMVLTNASAPLLVQQTVGGLSVDLSVAGAATADFTVASTFDWTLTGAATATLAGAMSDHATDYRLIVRQDGTGGRAFDLDTNNTITWAGMGTASPTFGTAANAVDVIGLVTTDDGSTFLGFHTNPDLTNPMTTAGDIIVGGAAGAPTRLAKGTDDQVLTMVSGSVAWAAASGGSDVVPWYIPPLHGVAHVAYHAVAANWAFYIPTVIPVACTVTAVSVLIGTSSGNISVALYDADGDRVATSGAVASPGTGMQKVAFTSSYSAAAGRYKIGISMDNETITWSIAGTAGPAALSLVQYQTSAHPCPATIAANGNTNYNINFILHVDGGFPA